MIGDVDAVLELAERSRRQGPFRQGGGTRLRRYSFVVHFHHRDHLGSVRVVTGEAGLEESATDWYPFGLEMVPDGQEVLSVSRKKYTGHERDEETGLDYMFARYKAARFGFFSRRTRWTTWTSRCRSRGTSTRTCG